MSVLLDVNLLLAVGWQSHPHHTSALAWLAGLLEFHLCPLAELGFLRVSIGPAYRVTFADALAALIGIRQFASARSLSVSVDVATLPALTSHQEVTDAYLVALAQTAGLRLATLDEALCKKAWAVGRASNPLQQPTAIPRD